MFKLVDIKKKKNYNFEWNIKIKVYIYSIDISRSKINYLIIIGSNHFLDDLNVSLRV